MNYCCSSCVPLGPRVALLFWFVVILGNAVSFIMSFIVSALGYFPSIPMGYKPVNLKHC